MDFKDVEIMAMGGLKSPFIAADSLYSPISEASIMTHRVFPGLCGLVPCGPDRTVASLFIDELPEDESLYGIVSLTTRSDSDGDPQECWLIQVQSKSSAWQFMTISEEMPTLSDQAVLLQWRPGALQEALKMHDEMIGEMGDSGNTWIIGSPLEKEAYSRFVLSTGFSSLAHPFQASGLLSKVLENKGEIIFMHKGPCLSMRAYPISWFQV